MNTRLTVKPLTFRSCLLLAAALVCIETTGAAKPSRPVGESVPSGSGLFCPLAVSPVSHSSPGAGDSFQVTVVSGGAGCGYALANKPSWITATNVGSSPISFTVSPNPGPARTATMTINGLANNIPTGLVFSVTVTQATLTCSYTLTYNGQTSLSVPFNAVYGANLDATASHPACPRTAVSNASWFKILSSPGETGSGPIPFMNQVNHGPARTAKVTLGNAIFTFNQGNGCDYDFSPTSKQFDATGGTGAINVTASDAACPRNADSNTNWITMIGGTNSTGSGPVTYSVSPNNGLARQGWIKLGTTQFAVTQLNGCTYFFDPNAGIVFSPTGGTGSIHVTASSSECVWSPLSGASWAKITNLASFTGNATLLVSVEPNQGAARSTTVSVNGKGVSINQNGAPPQDDCTFGISPASAQLGAVGGEVMVLVTASKSSCKWYVGAMSPFITAVSGGSGGIGNGSVKLKILANPGAPRTGTAEIAGKTFNVTQNGASAQTLIITDLSPGYTSAGGSAFQLIVKGVNFTSDCHVEWEGKQRATTFYTSSTLAASIPADDIANEGAFEVKVAKNSAESNSEEFMVYGAIANVSSASYSGVGVAPASLVSAFGGDLAKQSQLANTNPLPTDLAGTTAKVQDSTGKEQSVPLFYVSSGQVNYLMPDGVPLGEATVTITSGSGHTSMGTVQIVPVAPGVFSANSTGKGQAAALLLRVKANGQQVYEETTQYDQATATFVPKPIDVNVAGEQVYLALFGTGLRYRSSLGAVQLNIGGSVFGVLYAGAAPGYQGLDQINVLLTPSLAGRGTVDITLTADGKKANTVQVTFK